MAQKTHLAQLRQRGTPCCIIDGTKRGKDSFLAQVPKSGIFCLHAAHLSLEHVREGMVTTRNASSAAAETLVLGGGPDDLLSPGSSVRTIETARGSAHILQKGRWS